MKDEQVAPLKELAEKMGERSRAALIVELTADGAIHCSSAGANLDVVGLAGFAQAHMTGLMLKDSK